FEPATIYPVAIIAWQAKSDARHRRDGSGCAEQMSAATLHTRPETVLGLERLQELRDRVDHLFEPCLRQLASPKSLRQRHDTDRKGGPCGDAVHCLETVTQRAPPIATALRQIEPHQFGRSSSDIEDQSEVRVVVQEGRATGDSQSRLGLPREDFNF